MKPIHIILGVAILFSSTANATLLSVTQFGGDSTAGTTAEIIPAPAFATNIQVTNTGMQGFDEAQDVTISNLAGYDTDGVFFPAGNVPVNTTVDSHMIFMNSAGNTEIIHNLVLWTFKNPIIGIMSDVNGTLEFASTGELGSGTTTYPGSAFTSRGMELDPYTLGGFDALFYDSLDPYSLMVSSRVTEPGDWIRVLTAAVPVPAAVWLFGTALIGFIGFSRRRIVA